MKVHELNEKLRERLPAGFIGEVQWSLRNSRCEEIMANRMGVSDFVDENPEMYFRGYNLVVKDKTTEDWRGESWSHIVAAGGLGNKFMTPVLREMYYDAPQELTSRLDRKCKFYDVYFQRGIKTALDYDIAELHDKIAAAGGRLLKVHGHEDEIALHSQIAGYEREIRKLKEVNAPLREIAEEDVQSRFVRRVYSGINRLAPEPNACLY